MSCKLHAMSSNRAVVLLFMVACVDSLADFTKIPSAMPGFEGHRTYGQWFAAFRKAPCSWSGSKQFVNTNIFYIPDKKNGVDFRIMWGEKYCNTAFGKKIVLSPGVSLLNDHFGNLISGKSITVGTDYSGFLIDWGCTKFSVFGDRCEDHYVVVFTRTPKPDAKTISMINKSLLSLWGITVDHLDHVVQGGACHGGTKGPLYKN